LNDNISNTLNDQQPLNNESDSSTSLVTVDIKVGASFSMWKDAEIKLNQYAKFSGFL
jgi:hypothetical protein